MPKKYFLLLTLLASIFFFCPTLHYQYILSQEDHGRDLYTFAQISQGKHLYKDMWWEYGPLMPYYYALFNLIFGLKISSVLLGRVILNILLSLFFYFASCEVIATPWALVSTCFFMFEQQDFFYTYNHIGGIVLFMMLLWLILRYLRHGNPKNNLWMLLICLFIGFVKINFGFTALIACLLSVFIIKKSWSKCAYFYFYGLVLVPVLWILVYYFFLNGLTMTEINQCLPYFGANKAIVATPWESIKGYWTQNYINFLTDWLAFLEALSVFIQEPVKLLNPSVLLISLVNFLKILIYPMIYGSIIIAYIISLTNNFKNKKHEFWLIQLILWIFIILNFHEFIVSNIWYRFFWSQPFILFFFFFIISTTVSFAPQKYRYLIGSLFISLFVLITINEWVIARNACTPNKFITSKTGQIYVGNDDNWVNAVNTVSAYLDKKLKKDELFFVMPCDSLFYYLTDKPSPTRQTIFFNSFHITPQQEISIIKELEKNNVNYILLSNRIRSGSPELGVFGKTYCPLLYHYIKANFILFYQYGGNWDAPGGWANNLAIKLLKRKSIY